MSGICFFCIVKQRWHAMEQGNMLFIYIDKSIRIFVFLPNKMPRCTHLYISHSSVTNIQPLNRKTTASTRHSHLAHKNNKEEKTGKAVEKTNFSYIKLFHVYILRRQFFTCVSFALFICHGVMLPWICF